ncbi:MAG: Spy/CpxP family protein refolding chaperone [Candidatus Omnitrophica bacterium]|nr:Spy/CpxP family protein refolding chaperone [Candidatus Omnitrophota bacterium]
MKKIKDLTIVTMLIAAGVFLSAPAYAERDGMMGEGGKKEMRGRMEKMYQELGITDEQNSELKALREGERAKSQEIKARIAEIKGAMRAELDKPDTDKIKVDGYVDDLTALYREKIGARVEGVMSVKKILTPEQFSALHEKKEEMKKDRKERPHGRFHGRRGEDPSQEDEE